MWTPARSWFTAFIAEPAPGLVAELEHRLGDGVEHRAGGGEGLGPPEAMTESWPLAALRGPAGDRGVEIEDAGLGGARRHGPGEVGRDGGAGEDHRPGPEVRHDPAHAEEHRLGLGGVQHHDHHGVEAAGHFGQIARRAALGAEPRPRLRAGVEAERGVAGAQERAGDAVAHGAEAEHGDFLWLSHGFSSGINSGSEAVAVLERAAQRPGRAGEREDALGARRRR